MRLTVIPYDKLVIKDGEGVEVYLTQDVTTYHVKYKADHEDKVERSGRSFGVVGITPSLTTCTLDFGSPGIFYVRRSFPGFSVRC